MTFSALYPSVICKEERQGHWAPFCWKPWPFGNTRAWLKREKEGCQCDVNTGPKRP